MTDFGYMDVVSTCPVVPADGNTTTRIFGNDEEIQYRIVECPNGHTYGIKVDITVEAAVTEYTLVEPE